MIEAFRRLCRHANQTRMAECGLSGRLLPAELEDQSMLTFERFVGGRRDDIAARIDTLVIAGWAGRDQAAIEHHIAELA